MLHVKHAINCRIIYRLVDLIPVSCFSEFGKYM